MILNDSFLAVQFVKNAKLSNGLTLKEIFLSSYVSKEIKQELNVFNWVVRKQMADMLSSDTSRSRIYYITNKAQEEAEQIVLGKAIDLRWFNQIDDMDCIYVINKREFWRFIKGNKEINVIYYELRDVEGGQEAWYETFKMTLDDGHMRIGQDYNEQMLTKFTNLLLFVELGNVEVLTVEPNQKVKYGDKGDEKIKNESGLNGVKLINSNWNKIIVVKGDITVRSHYRMQPYGEKRRLYKLIQISEYTKEGYVVNKNKVWN